MKPASKTLLLLAGISYGLLGNTVVSASELYASAKFGQSHHSVDKIDEPGIPFESETDSFSSIAIGYGMTEAMALELAYNDFGSYETEGEFWEVNADLSSISLAAVGTLSFTDSLFGYGRVGFHRWEATGDWSREQRKGVTRDPVDIRDIDELHIDPFIALGVLYKLGSGLGVSLEYQMNDFAEYDTDVVAIGVRYGFSFGGSGGEDDDYEGDEDY